MTRTFPCRMYRTGLTPPTPFLSNAVKYSPGRGWGWPREGDLGPATVLSHFFATSVKFFPLLEGGNAVRFFHFVFFVSGLVYFVVFFRSSLLRVVV